jgi:hypothetical protein
MPSPATDLDTLTIEHQLPRDRRLTMRRNGVPVVEATWSNRTGGWNVELLDGKGTMFHVTGLDNMADPRDRNVIEPIHRLLGLLAEGLAHEIDEHAIDVHDQL